MLSHDRETDCEATAVLADYYRAFSTLDLQSVLSYFHEPSLIIGPQAVFAAPPARNWRLPLRPRWKVSERENLDGAS